MGMYRIIARLHNGNSIHCRFPNKTAAEVMKQCLENVMIFDEIKDIHLVKVSPPYLFPGRDYNRRQGPWCPYCGKITNRFRWNDYTLCEICWSSDECFEFKQINNTWFRGKDSKAPRKKNSKRLPKILASQRESINLKVRAREIELKRKARRAVRRLKRKRAQVNAF